MAGLRSGRVGFSPTRLSGTDAKLRSRPCAASWPLKSQNLSTAGQMSSPSHVVVLLSSSLFSSSQKETNISCTFVFLKTVLSLALTLIYQTPSQSLPICETHFNFWVKVQSVRGI
ncbi:hypothetical protein Droror1_Dr00016774 [Drosera rotundifolia]